MKARISFPSLTKKLFLTVVAALLGLFSQPGFAGGGPRHIAIDFGYSETAPTSSMNDSNGEAWDFLPGKTCNPLDQGAVAGVGCILDFTTATAATASSGLVSLGFNVNLNGVKYPQVHVNQNGVVTFVDALGAYTPVSDFASLQNVVGVNKPFIAGFYPGSNALVVPLAADPSVIASQGGVEYGRGLANPDAIDAGTSPDIVGDVAAFKASWFECPAVIINLCTVVPTNPAGVRIVLYNRYNPADSTTSDGDFDLRFEYDAVFDTGAAAGGQYGVIGFSLGSAANTVNLSGSAAAPVAVPGLTDIYYQFRKGALVGSAVIVPNVVGDNLAAATTAITGVGLIVGTTTTQSSPTVAAGNVISQDPAAGASAAAGSTVNLVLSSGKPTVIVPNVVNDTVATATSALTTVGLVVGTTTPLASSTVPSGSVISQSPASGATAIVGSAVNLVVSSGPATVIVPNVVNDTVGTATIALSGVGLKVGSIAKQTSSSVAAGSVISQTPGAGVRVIAGSAVNLVVSTGALRGDINHDGQVDVLDLYLLFEAYGKRVGAGDPRDLNGDGIINFKDIKILVSLCTNSYCSIKPIHHH